MMTSWLVLCAAGGHEIMAATVVERCSGSGYVPMLMSEDLRKRAMLPGYVFARWLGEIPWSKLDLPKTPRGDKLIYGYLAPAGSEEPARVFQHEIDRMMWVAQAAAQNIRTPRRQVGDLVLQPVGLTGAQVEWEVARVADGFATLQTVMLGKIIERKVREAA